MEEREWLAARKPDPMLDYVRQQAGDRKLRLFAVACCREVWDLLDAPVRSAVEVVERYADGEATRKQIMAARAACQAAEKSAHRKRAGSVGQAAKAVYWTTKPRIGECVQTVCEDTAGAATTAAVQTAGLDPRDWDDAYEKAQTAVGARQADLLRDCFGNPFRPVAVDPGWLAWGGGIVGRLARAAYEERAFDRLPVLADALEEAGCHDADVLGHCRGGGPHARGCWVLDLILSKDR
jgi:hypothetical protein